MKTITVFTPTYNRAQLLQRLYDSLISQTNKDFVWLIIDDGSTDNTREVVETWQSEKKIDIIYHFKTNGGMHTGHNAAYQLIDTELNVCIDSDDYVPASAIARIISFWKESSDKSNIAGIIGLDATENGSIIGTKIPEHLKKGSLSDLYRKYNVVGDKKLVLRTDIVKKYPAYPEYENEKLVPLGILYLMIGREHDFLYSNDIYCIVEYQEDGSSNTILNQYQQSPRGFAYARRVQLTFADNLRDVFKGYIHLVSSAIFAKDITLLWKGVNPLMSILTMPLAIVLNIGIRLKKTK